jgi:predicted nucleic acid-binding protein
VALVVDASVAFKWFVPETASEQALALLDLETPLIGPDLVLLEVVNAMWARLRGTESFPQVVSDAAAALPKMLDTIAPIGELLPRALVMAIELNHPLYDCTYLALAEREGGQLVTADQNFLGKVAASSFAKLAKDLESAV